MDEDVEDGEPAVAPELYFLVAKFLSSGPLKETNEVLRRELEKCKILPRRMDWEGNLHDQTFEELERQYPSVSDNHLLSVCSALLKAHHNKLRKSLLCSSLFRQAEPRRADNVVGRLISRGEGTSTCRHLLPAAVYCSLKLQRRTLGHLSSVYCVLFDRTGHYIITGADDLLVKVWSAVDGRLLGTLRGASAEITDVAIDTDNRLLAAGSLDRVVRVWDLQSAEPAAVLQGHNGMITSVHFCPRSGDVSLLASTSTDGSVAFWTYSSSQGKHNFISKPVQYVERMRPGACQMICGAWSRGGAFLAAGSADHHVRVYMMADSGPKRILETAVHADAVDSLQWAHTGLQFVSGSKDGTAILWQLHATQWRHTKLNMADTLPGEPVDSEEGKKLKVTMVAWNCSDTFIITAVNDCTLKVWSTQSGKLIKVLRGHKDEIYVLEAHPLQPHVLLSAGHDGQIFIWNILQGKPMTSFMNHIDGQGHCAVFDAKWSPDGSQIAATDSHGHLLMLGLGKGHPLLEKLPLELFFHTDYRPLSRDASGGVCDEQTGVPPHVMPPPFLVDLEGAPYPPPLQRLVPGRERAAGEQLVPDTRTDGTFMIPHSHIDLMIEALAIRRILSGSQQDQMEFDRDIRVQLQMPVGRMEGVRHSAGDWQSGDPLVPSRRALVDPLPSSQCQQERMMVEEMMQHELTWYRREMRRRPVMISTAPAGGGEAGRRCGGRRARGGGRPRAQPRISNHHNMQEPPEVASSQHSDSESSVRLSATEYSDDSNSSSSEQDMEVDSSDSSSEYSDWVADHPGVPLQPPKRSKRRPIARQRYSPTPKKNAASSPPSDPAVAGPSTVTVVPPQPVFEPPKPDVAELYRPSEWLCAVQPRKAPYHPQMGDECMYFKQGHARYLEAVADKNVYKIGLRDRPWERINLEECESVKVIGMKYMNLPPQLVCLKLSRDNGEHFTVRYHDMPDVLDFLVLKQTYYIAQERNWKPTDRFRCMIDDGWWMGAVESCSQDTGSQFNSLRVRWDNGEYEQMSPWDLEPFTDSRLPTEVGGSVPVLPSELEAMLYQPRPEEWPGGDRDEACELIAQGISKVMGLAIAENFVAPVDLNIYPTYARIVEYPIDLSTIKARFENHFYRRVTSAQFDVRYLATNAEKFNKPHTQIVKKARIITDLCLQIIRNPSKIDVGSAYHRLMESYESSDSDVPLAKQSSSRRPRDWVQGCRKVLQGLMSDRDSEPFRQPVSYDLLPEYTQVVSNPMDLGTVRQRLDSGEYGDPTEFASDVQLVFSNSKTFNTNKKSRIYAITLRLESLFHELFRPVKMCWKSAKRRSNHHATNGLGDSSGSESGGSLWGAHTRNGHTAQDSDSWDSDEPLRKPIAYKGKGQGKGAASKQMPTRTSKRCMNNSTPRKDNGWGAYNGHAGGAEWEEGERDSQNDSESNHKDGDSGDSYKPNNTSLNRTDRKRKRMKKGKRKKTKRRSNGRQSHAKHPKAKRRKRSSGVDTAGSSSDTPVSVASDTAHRRYESDHSFQLRPEQSDDEDNTPLRNIRDFESGRRLEQILEILEEEQSPMRLARRRFSQIHDQSTPGPSGSGNGRTRRPVAERPVYNEDSDEDSIAAISKRLRQHNIPRNINTSRMLLPPVVYQRHRPTPSAPSLRPAARPRRSAPSPGPSSSSQPTGDPLSGTESPPEDAPLSVSSRGRVRKLTAKARGLLHD